MANLITIQRTVNGETETQEVTEQLWENMKAGSTYGFTEVVNVPAELLKDNAPAAPKAPEAPADEQPAKEEKAVDQKEPEAPADKPKKGK